MKADKIGSSSRQVAALLLALLLLGACMGADTGTAPSEGSSFASASASVAEQPKGGVVLEVGDDFQKIVDRHPRGTRFIVKPGIHRLQSVRPKQDDKFIGAPGAVMSGARLLSSFEMEGDLWVASGQSQRVVTSLEADMVGGFELDNRPEELFFDGVPLRHVTRGEVGPGKWHFDYGADKIYLGNNPAGHVVETSVAPVAFHGEGVRNVVIENLTIRHYANAAQTGAIHGSGTIDWTIRKVDASWNHGVGIHVGPGSHLSYSKLNNNGQLGLRGESFDPDIDYGAPMVIEHNEIAHNKRLGYEWGWEGGAMKILHSTGTVLRNNWFHHNIGPGIWFDYDNHATTIQSNLVEDNTHIGIFYEVSYGPTKIRWNTVRRNGEGQPGHIGAGILISNSRDVQVVGNAVDTNERGIALVMTPRDRSRRATRGRQRRRPRQRHPHAHRLDGPPGRVGRRRLLHVQGQRLPEQHLPPSGPNGAKVPLESRWGHRRLGCVASTRPRPHRDTPRRGVGAAASRGWRHILIRGLRTLSLEGVDSFRTIDSGLPPKILEEGREAGGISSSAPPPSVRHRRAPVSSVGQKEAEGLTREGSTCTGRETGRDRGSGPDVPLPPGVA